MQHDFKYLNPDMIPTHDTEAGLGLKYIQTQYEAEMQKRKKREEEIEEED